MKPKEPLLSMMLTQILPGLGQFYSSRRLRAVLFLVVNVLTVTGAILYVMHPMLTLHPVSLILVVAFLLFYLFVLVDSYLCANSFNIKNNLERKISVGKRILIIFGILFFCLGPNFSTPLTFYIRSNIMQAFKIPADAMSPTMQKGDRIITDKGIYKKSEPQRGDVVVFVYPQDTSRDYIQRIVGLLGEQLEIRNGKVLINGQERGNTDNLANFYYYNRGEYAQEGNPVAIPSDSYYVLGDNSSKSHDSRFWGFVPKENIIGKAYKIYYPFDRSGPID